ncbi:Cytochrome b/b6 domain protein [Solidesulfovibrio carbinoliphilus subsp. oakridgensis]|uniref:Cytochrome b/b6 domain protein n=1 Tax=Solidesulfovibrio carbinoliphilus subsp. oakridgensis TaxID=694327 RepID=G7QC03_9BACT|nr:cytochrome b/b6 domain-containing protein [Solidesulfovibrio carbinoliphilus]EHJ46038.1 Cytochrome b/b6 domain protein [Solidesulfovibrio carbinoliphilus subsp. oakridgensis]
MNSITWGTTPWGQPVPLHAAWHLLWWALALGFGILVVHAVWKALQKPGPAAPPAPPALAACVPARVPRHSLPARLFHWFMAACMLTLLLSAFLPKAGVLFPWVGVHYAAGLLLIFAIAFHIVHAVFFMDFRSIWPTGADLAGFGQGEDAPVAARPGKYPLANKLYHLAIVVVGLTMVVTGGLMLSRIRTPFFTRNPYLFGDAAWGGIYLLHGLAGISLVALVIVHIYFAARPDEQPIARAMVTGSMDREFVLTHHDPAKWGCEPAETK